MAHSISHPISHSTSDSALLARIEQLEQLLAQHGIGAPRTATTASTVSHADIWFLLDRSGSMSAIAEHVVAGFDRFFGEQRTQAGTATVTLVQFDGEDPHDVLVDAQPIDSVGSIRGRFEPRGVTPLYDAIGRLLDRAERHVRGGADPADQLVVIFTDGLENASSDWTRERIDARIASLRSAGWTFVFLGANQDSYATGAQISMAPGSVSNFDFDAAGVAAAYHCLSANVAAFRAKPRHRRRTDEADFWSEAGKPER
jgi:hypothetical protein